LHPFIDFFGLDIPTYTVLFIAAIAAAWFLCAALARKSPARRDVKLTFIIGASGGLIGAALLRPVMHSVRIAFSWAEYRHMSFFELANYATGEIVFYGGLLGGLVAVVFYCRKFQIDLVQIFDIFAPALALAHAIGRLGCFFAGCCFGMVVDESHSLYPLAVIYPEDAFIRTIRDGAPRLPTQLFETVFLLTLCAIMVFLFLRTKKPGLSSAIYFFAYPVWRFFLEFFRADAGRGHYGLFTTSQYISIGLVIFAIFYVRRICIRFRENDAVPTLKN